MTPGDRPDLPLATEPALFLHPRVTGTAAPLGVQPAPGPFRLEEEPALWPGVAGVPAPARVVPLAPVRPRPAPGAPAGAAPVRGLPATGLPGVLSVVGGVVLGLAALLRRREQVSRQER